MWHYFAVTSDNDNEQCQPNCIATQNIPDRYLLLTKSRHNKNKIKLSVCYLLILVKYISHYCKFYNNNIHAMKKSLDQTLS